MDWNFCEINVTKQEMTIQNLNMSKELLGEVLVTGFNGLELSEETSAFLTQAKIGGVLLFSHNYENPAQVAELVNQVQDCRTKTQPPLWVSVDHEGGKVQRFKKGFTRIPEAFEIGAAHSPSLVFEISEMIAKELSAVGVNLNFSPVADIATNPKNPVIGNRSFGNHEEEVAKLVTAFVRGHLVHGVQPCVKHFPGHGDTSTDSHFALPRVDTDLAILQKREFVPFSKAFRSKCPMVMSAHILNARLDPKYPATLSKTVLQDILRGQLRYAGVIVSDDMEMKAITDHFGAEDAPVLALQAGCNLLLYRSEAACRKAYGALSRALDEDRLDPDVIIQSAQRLQKLKRTLKETHPISVAQVGKKLALPEYQAVLDKLKSGT